MLVAHDIKQIPASMRHSCVTIGNFDGVHLGHQHLIQCACARAKARQLSSVLVTFDPHPLRVLVGSHTPPFITLTRQKLELIAGLKPDCTLVLPFTHELASLLPEEFVQQYLVQGLGVQELIVGYDYHLGKARSGTFETLLEIGQRLGFGVERIEPVIAAGAIVSSTRIRDLVQAGHVWEAKALLSRFYQITGTVVHGKDRGGKLLGFPTANLKLEDELVPKHGVYAVWIELENAQSAPLAGVANIGCNPTFGNDAVSVEVHILDFDQDIYGSLLRIHFVQGIRDEQRFENVEALIERIKYDIELTRKILSPADAQAVLSTKFLSAKPQQNTGAQK